MLLAESVLADRLVTKREQIYCAGLSAFLWKICWCCASMLSLILLCFCLRIPPLCFLPRTFCICKSFFPLQYKEWHCLFEKDRAVQFWRTVHLPYRDAFLLWKLIWTSLGILDATMCFVEAEMEEPFSVVWTGTKKQKKIFYFFKTKENNFDLIV